MPRFQARIVQTKIYYALDEEGEDGVEAEDPSEADKRIEAAYFEGRVYEVDSYLDGIERVWEIKQ